MQHEDAMVESFNLTASFGAPHGDRTTLSKSCRTTLDVIYQHPISHNLEWTDVTALFDKLGTVEHKSNNEFVLAIGDAHRLMRKVHGKDLHADDVIALRHMLTRAGWSPTDAAVTPPVAGANGKAVLPDLLVVMDHHEARVYQLDLAADDPANHTIRPYDPHHFLHHLSHKDESRERGQRAAEDPSFYERIAQTLRAGGRIVIAGHGHGHSNAAHHLAAYLRQHHKDIAQTPTVEIDADLSSLTAPQMLALGRQSLGT
jgi:hypothetical protein